MQAVTMSSFGGPEVLEITDLPTPKPVKGEVLIRTIASGVNRADLLQRQGYYPPPAGESELLGLEISGIVAGLGPETSIEYPIGTEVVALLAGGGYAEYCTVPAGQIIAIPSGVSVERAGGLIEIAATVISNFDAARVQPGETVLIHGGAGGIGSFAIQYAKAQGCRVATTAGSAEKLTYARSLGADVVLDYHQDWVTELKDTLGRADVILDIIGAKYLDDNLTALNRNGRLVVIGLQGGVKATLNLTKLLNENRTILATSLRFRPATEKAAICAKVRDRVWPLVETGQINLGQMSFFPLTEVRCAHEQLASGTNIGKIILTH